MYVYVCTYNICRCSPKCPKQTRTKADFIDSYHHEIEGCPKSCGRAEGAYFRRSNRRQICAVKCCSSSSARSGKAKGGQSPYPVKWSFSSFMQANNCKHSALEWHCFATRLKIDQLSIVESCQYAGTCKGQAKSSSVPTPSGYKQSNLLSKWLCKNFCGYACGLHVGRCSSDCLSSGR